jgi:hypothetical protein
VLAGPALTGEARQRSLAAEQRDEQGDGGLAVDPHARAITRSHKTNAAPETLSTAGPPTTLGGGRTAVVIRAIQPLHDRG